MRRSPPHILVTTPESLYVLLGSESGRRMLATTRTVILDEIHAVARNKRGAHLALSLERLSALCGDRLQRIGLSATQNPIREVANLLIGANEKGDPAAEVAIVDSGHQRAARSRDRDAGLAARSGHVQRSLGPGLRTARRAHPRAPDDARLRQHAPHERTGRARAHRPARRGRGRHPSRQHGQGAAPRRRATAQARRA